MSDNEDNISHAAFDAGEHQPAFVYRPNDVSNHTKSRPTKRRKLAKHDDTTTAGPNCSKSYGFEALLAGSESLECISQREQLFKRSWANTEARIQSILNEANEDTLAEVTVFINRAKEIRATGKVPTGFIVTGPNISSQGHVFHQLSSKLKSKNPGPVTILRSGDASNLKSVLKQLIRDTTNQRPGEDDEDGTIYEQDGRKLLNYDLDILHSFVKAHHSQTVVVAFQDSEAFDTALVAELVLLFSSWMDRIPFILLFGIATSVELFHERLSRAASRCLYGAQFDVEQSSSLLERIFEKAVAGEDVPLQLGPVLVSSLMERQCEHMQSVQSFTAALKYAYMCHYYGNALSILNAGDRPPFKLLQPEHFQAIRRLPSFRKLIESLIDQRSSAYARSLLEDDSSLLVEIDSSLVIRNQIVARLLRVMSILSITSSEVVGKIPLYIAGFAGTLLESSSVLHTLDSIKRMAPDEILAFIKRTTDAVEQDSPEIEVTGRAMEEVKAFCEIANIQAGVVTLIDESLETGNPIRSSYAIHSNRLRTTVIAQRVQLSYQDSNLSDRDKKFTSLVERLLEALKMLFTLENPQDLFLHEVWLYDSTSPYREVFTPRPRAAIERALSLPHDYLNCECCESIEALSSTQPATAILYQMYLETGSLINVYDLWSAFLEMVAGGDDETKMEERDALVLFYKALADLKLLGLVKQTKRKADHVAKVAWKGL